jgi:peptidoglycan/LPS O-acetylase OafA/YrhL
MTLEQSLDPSARYHSLDAVRAFALLLGVVFHAAESFETEAAQYWAIGDNSPSLALDVFRHASHSFRLELFFLIAGFFAHFLWTKRGVGAFIRNRISRILIPLVVGWAIIYPILVLIWLTGAAKSGNWDILGVPEEARTMAPAMLTIGFFLSLGFFQEFDLTHLWFLHQLLVIYALALGLRFAVKGLPDSGKGLVNGLDRGLRAIISSPWQVPVFTAMSMPFLYTQRGWSVDTPKESLIPDPAPTLLFSFIFAVGWALHRQTDLLDSISKRWQPHMLLGLALIPLTRFLPWHLHDLGLFDQYGTPIRLGHYVLYGLMMWAFIFGFLGLFVRVRRTESAAWRYVADSSYWIYIAHLPIVVALQVWVARWDLHWSFKFLLINAIAFPILFLSYHFLVRSTFIGKQLNGRRRPFVLPFRGSARAEHARSAVSGG